MRNSNFKYLQRELLRSGIAPRHVRRTIEELNDHYDDLVEEALKEGADRMSACRSAARDIGNVKDIAGAVIARPELRSWAYRFPRTAAVVYPLTCIALLPAAPVLIGYANRNHIARWITCLFLSAIVTAGMFLVLQLVITLT